MAHCRGGAAELQQGHGASEATTLSRGGAAALCRVAGGGSQQGRGGARVGRGGRSREGWRGWPEWGEMTRWWWILGNKIKEKEKLITD
jgi:hypothetical protein